MIDYTVIKVAVIDSVISDKFYKLLVETTPIMIEKTGNAAQYNLSHLLDQMDDTYDEYEDLRKLLKQDIYYIEVQ